MRDIKFRAKVEGRWWFATPHSSSWEQFWAICDKTTLGQYIGRKDFHDKPIFEDDILRNKIDKVARVVYSSDLYMPGFDLAAIGEAGNVSGIWHLNEWEVIGNVYDNPELMP